MLSVFHKVQCISLMQTLNKLEITDLGVHLFAFYGTCYEDFIIDNFLSVQCGRLYLHKLRRLLYPPVI